MRKIIELTLISLSTLTIYAIANSPIQGENQKETGTKIEEEKDTHEKGSHRYGQTGGYTSSGEIENFDDLKKRIGISTTTGSPP